MNSNRLLLLISIGILTFSTCIVSAQDNKGDLIKLDLGIFNKIRVGYEHPITNAFSAGANVDFYYGSFPGFKLEPFGRFYPGGQSPSGLYGQIRFLYGSFNKNFIYYDNSDNMNILIQKSSISSLGGGLDLGYQWLSGRNENIVIDLSIGVQIMNDVNNSITENNIKYSTANVGFLTTGPGGIFNPHLMIGYKF